MSRRTLSKIERDGIYYLVRLYIEAADIIAIEKNITQYFDVSSANFKRMIEGKPLEQKGDAYLCFAKRLGFANSTALVAKAKTVMSRNFVCESDIPARATELEGKHEELSWFHDANMPELTHRILTEEDTLVNPLLFMAERGLDSQTVLEMSKKPRISGISTKPADTSSREETKVQDTDSNTSTKRDRSYRGISLDEAKALGSILDEAIRTGPVTNQKAVAKILGLDSNTVSRARRGDDIFTVSVYNKLAKLFGLSTAEELVEGVRNGTLGNTEPNNTPPPPEPPTNPEPDKISHGGKAHECAEDVRVKIGEILVAKREDTAITRGDLATAIGISYPTLDRLEKSQSVGYEVYKRVGQYLGYENGFEMIKSIGAELHGTLTPLAEALPDTADVGANSSEDGESPDTSPSDSSNEERAIDVAEDIETAISMLSSAVDRVITLGTQQNAGSRITDIQELLGDINAQSNELVLYDKKYVAIPYELFAQLQNLAAQ